MSNERNELSISEKDYKAILERNNDLARENQFLKMELSRRDEEKLDHIRENNELRLKLSRLLNGRVNLDKQLDAGLQETSKDALSHIVQASTAIAKSIEIAKTYLKDRQDLEKLLPKWSGISNTPADKVQKVPPIMMGGQFIQPVVSLNRHVNTRPTSANTNHSNMALPMHMLQDVYIPLTRIDMEIPNISMENPEEADNMENSAEDLGLVNDLEGSVEENRNEDGFDAISNLEVVREDSEIDNNESPRVSRSNSANPLEGPSFLDVTSAMAVRRTLGRITLEADSTTQLDDSTVSRPNNAILPDERSPVPLTSYLQERSPVPLTNGLVFSPTRRRKRPVPHTSPSYSSSYSPPPPPRSPPAVLSPLFPTHDPGGSRKKDRILKVIVPKMVFDESSPCGVVFPSTEPRFDAPSPNGATVPCVVVLENSQNTPDNESASTSRHLQPRSQRRESHDAGTSRTNRRNRSASLCETRPSPVDIKPSPALFRPSPRTSRTCDDQSDSRQNTDSHKPKIRKLTTAKNKAKLSRHVATRSPASDIGDTAFNTLGLVDTQSARANGSGDTTGLSSRRASVSDSSSGDDAGGNGRSRRNRKPVTYKEKPLNRKMRR